MLDVAERYFRLALALSLNIKSEPTYAKIKKFWKANDQERRIILDELKVGQNLMNREVSYSPPAGSIEIR